MSRSIYGAWAVFVFLLIGCAHQDVRTICESEPEMQKDSNAAFDARLDIEKQAPPFYVFFQLTLTNKTDSPLAIDWNRTRYHHNGKDLGVSHFRPIIFRRSLGVPVNPSHHRSAYRIIDSRFRARCL